MKKLIDLKHLAVIFDESEPDNKSLPWIDTVDNTNLVIATRFVELTFLKKVNVIGVYLSWQPSDYILDSDESGVVTRTNYPRIITLSIECLICIQLRVSFGWFNWYLDGFDTDNHFDI